MIMMSEMMNIDAYEPTAKTRVLILGGGFGGFYAALHLDKTIVPASSKPVADIAHPRAP